MPALIGAVWTPRGSRTWASAAPRRAWWAGLGQLLLILCAVALWSVSLAQTDVRGMTDLGLVSVLPPAFFVGFLALIVSFCLTLGQQRPHLPTAALQLVVLTVMLYGTAIVVEGTTSNHVAWRHVGFTEYIARTGSLAPTLDTYFSWPGFFALSAFSAQVAGASDVVDAVAWAPLFFNLVYLGPVVMLLRALTADWRVILLGAWVFCLTKWAGNDFFAPQAFGYLFYLVIVAVLMRWFIRPEARAGPAASSEPRPTQCSSPLQRIGLLVIVVSLFAVIASSHQLTPFFAVASVSALVLLGRITPRALPITMGVIVVAWISFMTVAFLAGHLDMITGGVGRLDQNVQANVVDRLRGSTEHLLVVQTRLALSATVWGLALLGGFRRFRKGFWDVDCAILTLVPFGLLGLQAYGGELLLRIYLFALPSMVFLAGASFYVWKQAPTSWLKTVGIGCLSFLLGIGFLITRYGNERMDFFTPQEVATVQYAYQIAPPHALLVAPAFSLPWMSHQLEQYEYAVLPPDVVEQADVASIVELMQRQAHGAGAVLIVTRSEQAELELANGLDEQALHRLEQALTASGQFREAYRNDDGAVFLLLPSAGQAAA